MESEYLAEQDIGPEQPNRVKEFRLFSGLSQTLLAEKTECSVRTISRIEAGHSASDLVKFRIARVLNVSVEEVFPSVSRLAEPAPLGVHSPRTNPSWCDRLLNCSLFASGPEIRDNLVRPSFLIDGQPVQAQATLLQRLNTYWGFPVICGEFGSGKTICTALMSEQLDPKVFNSVIVPVATLSRSTRLVDSVHQLISNVYGDGLQLSLRSTKSIFLVIDGLEDLAFDWSVDQFNTELDELVRYVFSMNILFPRVFPVFTANDLFAHVYLGENPNLDLFWLQAFTVDDEEGELPLLSKWWTRHIKKYLNLDWPKFMESIITSDFGGYTTCPLANGFVSQYLNRENYKSFYMKHEHHRSFLDLLFRRSWSLAPVRKYIFQDFEQIAEIFAVCDMQKSGFNHDAFLLSCDEYGLSKWVRHLGLHEYGRFVRSLALFPITMTNNRYTFRLSGLRDWLVTRFTFRLLKNANDSLPSYENALDELPRKGFMLTVDHKNFLKSMLDESAPRIRLVR